MQITATDDIPPRNFHACIDMRKPTATTSSMSTVLKPVTYIIIHFCPQKGTGQTQEQKCRKVHNFWYISSCFTVLSVGTLFYLTTLVSTSQIIM